MIVRQTNIDNIGISDMNFRGYIHRDGLLFDVKNKKHKILRAVGDDIVKVFPKAKTFLDVGCGSGAFAHNLRKYNVEVITVDGNIAINNSPMIDKNRHIIARTDQDYTIVDENNEIVKFDIICSFEHFEHIHPDSFDVFMDNLKKHSHKDTILIATASKNKSIQRDDVHCNVKNEHEWKEYMSSINCKKNEIKIITAKNWGHRFPHSVELIYNIGE